MTPSEKDLINKLVQKIANKNMNAVGTLYELMFRVLFCFVKNNCKDKNDVVDIINDTFVTIIEKANEIQYANCYGWILSVAHNKARNHTRKFQKNNIEFNEAFMNCYSIDEAVEFEALLSKLDKGCRNIIYLKFYANLTNNEIAKILRISVSTVKRRLKKSLKFLEGEVNE